MKKATAIYRCSRCRGKVGNWTDFPPFEYRRATGLNVHCPNGHVASLVRIEWPCEKCGGKVDPNEGTIGVIPWTCAKCTVPPAVKWEV